MEDHVDVPVARGPENSGKPALHYLRMPRPLPTILGPQGCEAQKNLPICLIPQDTGLVGGALRDKEGRSGPLTHLAPKWVTESTHEGTTHAAGAIPPKDCIV